MNAIGIVAVAVFLISCLGTVITYFAFDIHGLINTHSGQRFGIWNVAHARKRFLIFVFFCTLGVVAGLIGFLFGDWPT